MELQASVVAEEDGEEGKLSVNAADANFLLGEETSATGASSSSSSYMSSSSSPSSSSSSSSSSSDIASTETQSIDDPPQLSLSLKPFQRHAVAWMLAREAAGRPEEGESGDNSPADDGERTLACSDGGVRAEGIAREQAAEDEMALWEERWVARRWREVKGSGVGEVRLELSGGVRFWLNPFGRRWRTERPPKPRGTVGGILADEMGLGKTIMILGLLCADKNNRLAAKQAARSGADSAGGVVVALERSLSNSRGQSGGGTLVVCPMSLIQHWHDELTRHTQLAERKTRMRLSGEVAAVNAGPLSVCIFYGNGRASANLSDKDVVVTSFGVVSSEFHNGAATSGIFQLNWRRVVLDEAHTIKNTGTTAAVAVRALKAARRWAVTGTPLQNGLGDVFALLRALHHEPWCEPLWWREAVTKPHLKGDPAALSRLRAVLQPLMLRRTKATIGTNGQPIVVLPSKDIVTVSLDFSSAEREFYDALLARSRSVINRLVASGTAATSYIQMLTLLLRLRQACSHPFLVLGNELTAQILKEAEPSRPRSKVLTRLWASNGESAAQDTAASGETLPSARNNNAADTSSISDAGKATSSEVSDSYLRALLGKFGESEISSNDATGATEGQRGARVAFFKQVSQSISSGLGECAVCLEPPARPTLLPCGHTFCRACLLNCFAAAKASSEGVDGACPLCEAPVVLADVLSVDPTRGPIAAFASSPPADAKEATTLSSVWLGTQAPGCLLSSQESAVSALPAWRPSIKLAWLKSHLTALHRDEPQTKV
jgi:SNF2 family DNA or RNA helicase